MATCLTKMQMSDIKCFDDKGDSRDISGYDVQICDEGVKEEHFCPFCKLLMRNPVQTFRGQLACNLCYKKAKSDSATCPLDDEPIQDDEIFLDKFRSREILQFQCQCSHKEYGCTWQGTIGENEEHEDTCEHKPVTCVLCDEKVDNENVDHHLKTCFITNGNGKCIFTGCPKHMSTTEELMNHLEKSTLYHAHLLSTMVSDTRNKCKNHIAFQEHVNKEKMVEVEAKISNLQNQLSKMNQEMKEREKTCAKMLSDIRQTVQGVSDNRNDVISNDMSTTVTTLQRKMSELDLRQQLSDNTSYDGHLVWKIDNISRRMEDAARNRVVALHSAPVYTERYGYKFCGRIFLNGDGLGRQTHASLFFVLMKSEYDGLLTWPFQKRISMRLINQDDRQNDVIECFDSDVTSSSFQQPSNDMNISSGCPRFVSQERLQEGGFIKDDVLFIELTVSDRRNGTG